MSRAFELISEDFAKAKERYRTIMTKEGAKFMSFVAKSGMEKKSIKTKEEFLSKE